MKIIELHIYGYGQLENLKITSLGDFQVFYGENEAGKSTIMAFIHGILFGFPTKLQSELRYEPKHSTKYGGKIRIYHEELGFAIIERVKGKASGDVKVILDNGTIGGEDLLKDLVANFDKSIFQAIFSFNVHGLQNIHQMKGDDIGKFLFSAGTLGTEKLAKTEIYLQKELESRFKPSGKKPIVNEKLQAIHEINGELKKAAAKNKEYESLVAQKESLLQEMKEIDNTLLKISKKVEKLNEWKRIEAIVKEEKWIKKELHELGDIEFPARGMEKLDKLTELIRPYKLGINSIREKIEMLKKELAANQPDLIFLENEAAINLLLDQVLVIEQLKREKQQCETKLAEFEEKLALTREKLHLPLNEEELFTINTNIYMKNQVEVVSRKKQKLLEVKEELEKQYQEEKNSLEDIEKSVQLANSQVLAIQERKSLEEQVNSGNDKKSLEWELAAVQDKVELYQQAIDRDKASKERAKKEKWLLFSVVGLLLFVLSLYGLLTQQWILLFLGMIPCIFIAIFMVKAAKQTKDKIFNYPLASLKEKEKQLLDKLQSAEYMDITKLEERLAQDNHRCEEVQMLRMKCKQQESHFEKIISKFEVWETEAADNKEKLLAIGKELKVPENIAISFLAEAFELIEQSKSIGREKRQLQLRLEQISGQQTHIVEGLKNYENQFLQETGIDVHNSAYLLRIKLKKEHEKQVKYQEKLAKLAELEDELKEKLQELRLLQGEYNELIHVAKVETEQQFNELGAKYDKKEKLVEKLETLQSQLQYSILSEEEREKLLLVNNSDELIKAVNQEEQELLAKLKEFQGDYASIKYEIQILEDGGVYSDILHNYKQKKYELEEVAEEWSIYSLAQDILSETIEKYKSVHLPRMITKAEEYMSILTNGRYQKIHMQKSGSGFLVERDDFTLFEANELSQATTEQLYLSIRLALATTLYEKYSFPIIIDDSFVNFDEKRTQKVIELLKTLERNQLLFFTCHPHLLQLFQPEQIIYLEKGAVQII